MKKLSLFFAGLLLLVFSISANAQSKTGADYFVGKWNVLIKGTPNGDARMFIILEQKDTTMSGSVQDSAGVEMSKISSVELKDTTVTVYFTAQGYDVNLVMDRKDDDHVIGNLMGMFDAEGDRVKEIKQ
jgi:hypothetical protein